MNRLTIIGNLTRDPELRSVQTANGAANVCDFTVAVNRRRKGQNGQDEADFFRVTAWNQLGENASKYLAKGRKVCIIGPVSVSQYTGNDGVSRSTLEVTADEVEFLTPRSDSDGAVSPAGSSPVPQATVPQTSPPAPQNASYPASAPAGFTAVNTDDLPF